jgi:hypothetical protein
MKTKVFMALTMLTIISLVSEAQEKDRRFGFEINGGPSFATNKFADGLRMGFGTEGLFHYRFMPHTGIYAGWGANWLTTENLSSELNRDYEETGYVLGLQFKHPAWGSRASFLVRAGMIYSHIEVENDNGEILEDTGHGAGLQLAAGMDFKLGSSWSLTPFVKYHSLNRPLNSEEGPADSRFSYLSVRVGILKMF